MSVKRDKIGLSAQAKLISSTYLLVKPVGRGRYQLWLKVGVQEFPVGPLYSKSEADWYDQMLAKALDRLVNQITT